MKFQSLCFCMLAYTSIFSQVNKAPAYPLITHDPYFSIWSFTDEVNASPTKHWTGADQALLGIIKVDGRLYRFLGSEEKNFITILPAADELTYTCKYSETTPGDDWMQQNYNDDTWKTTEAPFSSNKKNAKTVWQSKNIWVRRSFELNDLNINKLFLKLHHDDNVEVYLNGELIYNCNCWNGKPQLFPLNDAVKSKLVKGQNILAIHCANTAGGAFLDAGLAEEPAEKNTTEIIKAEQLSVDIKATQTIYKFSCGPVNLSLTFTSPLIMNNPGLLSRPVSYVSFSMHAIDGKTHDTKLYWGASSTIAVNTVSQTVSATKATINGLSVLKVGSVQQPVLEKKGDDLRIDWGYLYVAVPASVAVTQSISRATDYLQALSSVKSTAITEGKQLMLNTVIDLGKLSATPKDAMIMQEQLLKKN